MAFQVSDGSREPNNLRTEQRLLYKNTNAKLNKSESVQPLTIFEQCGTEFLNELSRDIEANLMAYKETVQLLKAKIKDAEELGLVEEAKQLKREFMDTRPEGQR